MFRKLLIGWLLLIMVTSVHAQSSIDTGLPARPIVSVNQLGYLSAAPKFAMLAGRTGIVGQVAPWELIDAATGALGAGMEPWRTGGRDGGRLSADFVLSVLFSMRASGQCFRDVRRCVETCVVIAQDCEPCAEDAECAAAFKEVCGEALGTCTP